jgi:hypothetical protein
VNTDDWDELQTVVNAIVQVHRKKAYSENAVPQILLDFLKSAGSQVKAGGQVLAVAALAEEFQNSDTARQLLRIVKNRGKRYPLDVQKRAVTGLVSLAANDDDLCTNDVCDAICSFLRSNASSDEFDVQTFVQDELADILPEMGERMLGRLVQNMIQYRKVGSSEIRKQRIALDRAIRLFGKQALGAMLSLYRSHQDNQQTARPLIMSLKMLAMDNPEFLEMGVDVSNSDKQVTLLETLITTVERNAPAADLAIQALGQLARHGRVEQLLWSRVRDNSVRAEVRSSCLWTLYNSRKSHSPDIDRLCRQWLSSRIITLEAIATLILFDRGDQTMGERFAQMLESRRKAATRLCRAASGIVISILRDMLQSSSQRQVAVEQLVGLGRQGWDVLGREYCRSKDARARIAMLEPFLSIPSRELRRYEHVIDRALSKGDVGEKQLAEEIIKRIATLPMR